MVAILVLCDQFYFLIRVDAQADGLSIRPSLGCSYGGALDVPSAGNANPRDYHAVNLEEGPAQDSPSPVSLRVTIFPIDGHGLHLEVLPEENGVQSISHGPFLCIRIGVAAWRMSEVSKNTDIPVKRHVGKTDEGVSKSAKKLPLSHQVAAKERAGSATSNIPAKPVRYQSTELQAGHGRIEANVIAVQTGPQDERLVQCG